MLPKNVTNTRFIELFPLEIQNPNATGFYLAIVNIQSCVVLLNLLVYNYVCPSLTHNLIMYPTTNVGINEVLPRVTNGKCVDGAIGEFPGKNIELYCQSNTSWAPVPTGRGCVCKPGYRSSKENTECIGSKKLFNNMIVNI